jgi:hypothetical protein
MTSYVNAGLRHLVESRAHHACEYCLIRESDTYLGCQVDHVVSEKHGGATDAGNLAYSCTPCNRAKGTDIGSISDGRVFVRFYNPRIDRWYEHFRIRGPIIEPLTAVGEVTVKILSLNARERVIEREVLQRLARYPTS